MNKLFVTWTVRYPNFPCIHIVCVWVCMERYASVFTSCSVHLKFTVVYDECACAPLFATQWNLMGFFLCAPCFWPNTDGINQFVGLRAERCGKTNWLFLHSIIGNCCLFWQLFMVFDGLFAKSPSITKRKPNLSSHFNL